MIKVGLKQTGRLILAILGICGVLSNDALAVANTEPARVVITALQTADPLSASNEFIQLVNNTSSDIDITGWCIYYSSSNNVANGSRLLCVEPTDILHRIILPAQSGVIATSSVYRISYPAAQSDLVFNAGLANTGGHITLVDAAEYTVDKVGWGTAAAPEGVAAQAPNASGYLRRWQSIVPEWIYQDSNDNNSDFVVDSFITIAFSGGLIFEAVDYCLNMDGFQVDFPVGFWIDSVGNCFLEGYTPDIENPQESYSYPDLHLQITELFPNPDGSDAENEYIEIYNPNDVAVDLSMYKLLVGTDEIQLVGFNIEPHQYLVLRNSELPFTLTNTKSQVILRTMSGEAVSQTDMYDSAPDGQSWSLIQGVWQFTSVASPGAINPLSSSASVEPDNMSATLTPCLSGQYRSPETNRCRKIADADQGSALVPCKENQERSSETNRCRSVASATSTLKGCAEGQERNPETNRCRNITAEKTPAADYAVLGERTDQKTSYVLWVVLGVALLGIAYICWEWRSDISRFITKIKNRLRMKGTR